MLLCMLLMGFLGFGHCLYAAQCVAFRTLMDTTARVPDVRSASNCFAPHPPSPHSLAAPHLELRYVRLCNLVYKWWVCRIALLLRNTRLVETLCASTGPTHWRPSFTGKACACTRDLCNSHLAGTLPPAWSAMNAFGFSCEYTHPPEHVGSNYIVTH
jgi:hypothetical protein